MGHELLVASQHAERRQYMQYISPYLNFAGNTEEAFEFYRSVFGGDFTGILRFRDMDTGEMEVPESALDKVAHISLPLSGNLSLMASDVVGSQADSFVAGNNVYLYIETDSGEEAERLFSSLSDGGSVLMPLQGSDWAEKYGMCVDRFSIQWMISYTGDVEFSM
jgi:PhnB protein